MSYKVLERFPDNSPEWLAQRQGFLGASDVAAVLGLSPYQSPLSVYRSKMGIQNEIPENLAYFGHALEEPLASWVADKHPEIGAVGDGIDVQSVECPWLAAKPDRLIDGAFPLELKSSSAFAKSKWADGVPLYYQAQVQTQIFVLDAPYGWLAVLHGGNDPELYRVERDDVFIQEYLIPKTREFWESHVLAKIPPEPTTSAEAVELWPGVESVTVEGSEELYELWGAYGLMQAEQVELSEKLDGIKLQLQLAMKDATALTFEGRELFTWKPRKGSRTFDTARFKKEHPELAADYMKQGTPTRVFKRVKEKDDE